MDTYTLFRRLPVGEARPEIAHVRRWRAVEEVEAISRPDALRRLYGNVTPWGFEITSQTTGLIEATGLPVMVERNSRINFEHVDIDGSWREAQR